MIHLLILLGVACLIIAAPALITGRLVRWLVDRYTKPKRPPS